MKNGHRKGKYEPKAHWVNFVQTAVMKKQEEIDREITNRILFPHLYERRMTWYDVKHSGKWFLTITWQWLTQKSVVF